MAKVASRELRGLELIPDDQWAFYKEVIAAARATGEPFALGGAFAWATYTGLYRNTKDLDLYVMRESKDKFIAALDSIGARDYFDELGYDRGWIYRSTRDGYICDIIFDTANYRFPIDRDYVTKGATLGIRGEKLLVLPAEELLMNKLFIISRGRCDWFDVFNILYCTEGKLDFDRILTKLGPEQVLFASAMNIFAWLCPGRVDQFPKDIWHRLGLSTPSSAGPDYDPNRVKLLDTRAWFIPALEKGEQIFVDKK